MTRDEFLALSPEAQQAYYEAHVGKAAAPAAAPAAPTGPPPQASPLASAIGGFAEGATFDNADELAAHAASGLGGGNYEDELARRRDTEVTREAAHPNIYGASKLAGNVAGGMLMPGKWMTSAGRALLTGGGVGALSGWGASEATDAAGQAQDAATGGLTGAAAAGVASTFLAGVGRVMGVSMGRALEKEVGRLADSSGMTADEIIGHISQGDDLASLGIDMSASLRAAVNRMRGTALPPVPAAPAAQPGVLRTAAGMAGNAGLDLASATTGLPIGTAVRFGATLLRHGRSAGISEAETNRLARILVSRDPGFVQAVLANQIPGREITATMKAMLSAGAVAAPATAAAPTATEKAKGQSMLELMMNMGSPM